ncbi:MAG: hypothetical protein ACLVJH_15130 [Faecalibacterium prausnitzii]
MKPAVSPPSATLLDDRRIRLLLAIAGCASWRGWLKSPSSCRPGTTPAPSTACRWTLPYDSGRVHLRGPEGIVNAAENGQPEALGRRLHHPAASSAI